MFRLTSLIPPSIRSRLSAPRPLASLCSGIAAFSSTRRAAITRAAREAESEEARAARLERQREYQRAYLARETEEGRQERLANKRKHYFSSPHIRERHLKYRFEYIRNPNNRPKLTAYERSRYLKDRDKMMTYARERHAEDLKVRRANVLSRDILHRKRWLREKWSWSTHEPALYPTRVDHHCTNCDSNRYLRLWWKEKHPSQKDTESPQDRYMCNYCFANRWDLVVPESNIKRPPGLFTSPDHPPPPERKSVKQAQQQDQNVMEEKKA